MGKTFLRHLNRCPLGKWLAASLDYLVAYVQTPFDRSVQALVPRFPPACTFYPLTLHPIQNILSRPLDLVPDTGIATPASSNLRWWQPRCVLEEFPIEEFQLTPFEKAYTGDTYSPCTTRCIAIMNRKPPERLATLLHDELWGIIKQCWDQESEKYPTASQLLETFRLL